MKRHLSTFGSIILLVAASICFSACEKDDRDYELTVIVTTYDTIHVANALVYLYAPVSNTFVTYYNYTNEAGKTNYTFKNKVIVEIEAAKGSFKGCGFAEVNRGTNTVTIDLKPFGVHNPDCP